MVHSYTNVHQLKLKISTGKDESANSCELQRSYVLTALLQLHLIVSKSRRNFSMEFSITRAPTFAQRTHSGNFRCYERHSAVNDNKHKQQRVIRCVLCTQCSDL